MALRASRQVNPAAPSLLERGDDLYTRGDKEGALAFYRSQARTAEDAVRDLIRSRDPWLAACAMAAAAELGMRNLAPEIHQAAAESEEEVLEVARSAEARLAA